MNIKSKRKYLLLIPLAVSLIMLTFFAAAHEEIVRQKYEQRYHSIKSSLDLIASQIDRFVEEDQDWDVFDYISLLRPMLNEIDELPMVYRRLAAKSGWEWLRKPTWNILSVSSVKCCA